MEPHESLTPEQREILAQDKAVRAQRDGEAMLAAIHKDQPPGIVGADGQPVGGIKTDEQRKAEAAADARKKALAHTDAMAARLQKMVAEDKIAASAVEALMDGYRLVYWATLELANTEGADDEVLKFAGRYLEASVQHGKGFDIRKLRARLRDVTMPFLNDRLRHYEALGVKRKKAFTRVRAALSKTGAIPLPFPSLGEKFGKDGFKPGRMLLLCGRYEDTQIAISMLSQFFSKAAIPVTYLGIDEKERDGFNETVMPSRWWKGCCTDLRLLSETLKSSIIENKIVLLGESLLDLGTANSELVEEDKLPAKVMAIHRMYQWTVEHMMCSIVADELTQHQLEAMYGLIPYVKVTREGDTLIVGADKITIK